MPQRVTVIAPSRLHFGLYGFGDPTARQFGGVGAMVELPALRLVATHSDVFAAAGPLADRVTAFAAQWSRFHRLEGLPRCRIEMLEAPREHTGLGVGTQLGLSVATALGALHELPSPTPAELALSVERGRRSAVGTYGFLQGGLIAERGKLAGEAISPLDLRVALPADWRFVLVTPQHVAGLAGQAEVQAFEQLPPVAESTSQELVRLARDELLPAAVQAEFSRFAAALDRYCYLAGMCFANAQGGPFNGPVLTRFVESMRASGAAAVGQSSWGPTLFTVFASQGDAEEFVRRLQANAGKLPYEALLTPANNRGAEVRTE